MKPSNPSIVFMGSPEFSVPSLRILANQHHVLGVVTQPDRPAGRGRTLSPPPVKQAANDLGLPVIQPNRLREPEAMEQLRRWNPDLIVVAAFGQILRPDVLDLPAFGCINVHASLLPRWRGAAPIQAAILHGDVQTGVTIMRMDPGVDTGPIIQQMAVPILPAETAGQLSERLAELGATLLADVLPGYLNGQLQPQAQDSNQATYAAILKKDDGELDFNKPAAWLARQVRAFQPWPGAFTFWQNQPLKIIQASTAQNPENRATQNPGQHLLYQGLPAIETSEGCLVLETVQPAGKKAMDGKSFLQGARTWLTD